MKFEIGKAYRHTSGEEMKIVGLAQTHVYGMTTIAEHHNGGLSPIGWDSDSFAENWAEITEEEWMKGFAADGHHHPCGIDKCGGNGENGLCRICPDKKQV